VEEAGRLNKNDVVRGRDAFRCMMPWALHHYASEFMKAGKSLGMKEKFPPVGYFLYCRSIELALKAFLMTKNISVNTLKRKKGIGHDLERALEEAEKQGLLNIVEIPDYYEEELRKANYYYKGKAFEYYDNYEAMTKAGDELNIEVLSEFSSILVEKLKKFCLESAEDLAEKSKEGKLVR
jgi:hypothetical protein